MRLFSYVVARDFGFAPNPFHGVCTLATCKPRIRAKAEVGDWIVGTGSKRYLLHKQIVYAMQISEILTFAEYWQNDRFIRKRPYLSGSLKQAYGDNIYHRDPATGLWLQENSHHSLSDGTPNQANIMRDTHSPRVLVGEEFYYWGSAGPTIPDKFSDTCLSGQGHRCNFPSSFVNSLIDWIRSMGQKGYLGEPSEWAKRFRGAGSKRIPNQSGSRGPVRRRARLS